MTQPNLLLLSATAIFLTIIGMMLWMLGMATIGIVVMFVASAASLVAWIMGLIMAGQRQQWGWLVVIALFNAFGTLLYAALGVDDSRIPVG
jgi:hypothetical protein